jgi:hypothetical protein
MAKAKAENSTSDEIWFNDAVVLLTDGCGSTEFAEQLLIRGLRGDLRGDRVPWSHMREDGTRIEGDAAFWNCKTAYLVVRRVENKAFYDPLTDVDLDDIPATVYGIRVSRAAALALLPSTSQQRQKRKRKPARLVGRPPDYEHDAIAGLAEDYVRNNGLPRTQALLREKVADACRNHKPRTIEVPGETVLKEIVGLVWRRLATKSRKVGN